MKLAIKKGLNIPKDLSIIGYTNGVISKYSTPSLSSIVQHGYQMGKSSAEMLIDRIDNDKLNKAPRYEVIGADIVKRESTL